MNSSEIIQNIIINIRKAQEEEIFYKTIYSQHLSGKLRHEFIFFIKPEVTLRASQINLEEILNLVFEKLLFFKLQIKDIRILSASYLEKYNIITQHYGIINSLSKNPLKHLSNEAANKFLTLFGKKTDEVCLLGSFELLQKYPDFTPISLNKKWGTSKNEKLAGGTYCAKVNINGKEIYLINGFHPCQIIHFTQRGRSIVTFTLAGDLDWSVARNSFIGKTNPAEASRGSLRNELLTHQKEYGLNDVSSSQNGFHLSAGPVEGMVELIRYCSDYSENAVMTPDDFIFGQQLKTQFDSDTIQLMCNNQLVVHNGTKVSVFDLTEEKNTDLSIKLLKESAF